MNGQQRQQGRQALIFAGPNGSGKSTLTRQIREEGFIPFPGHYINADDIAREAAAVIPAEAQEARERAAFRRARELRQEYRERGLSFAFETVFSHPSTLVDLMRLKQEGYVVTLVFVTTGDVEVNVARVARRVRAGGHDVPEDKIRARYERGLTFLPQAVEIADQAFVYDSTDVTTLAAIGWGGRLYVPGGLPAYLDERLRVPLEQRQAERDLFSTTLKPGETLEAPDEQAGVYQGTFREMQRHYVLQECGENRVVLHNRCLLTPSTLAEELTTGKKYFWVRYTEGYGVITLA